MRIKPTIILLFICAVLLINGRLHQYRSEYEAPRIPVQTPLAALHLHDDDGKGITVDAASMGGKVTVVNFFASWCVPCKIEMPELVKLKKQSGAQFVGIAWNATPDAMQAWLKQTGNPFDIVRYDDTGESLRVLGLRGIPETFILDKKGVVRYHVTGAIEPDVARDKLLPLLAQLRNE